MHPYSAHPKGLGTSASRFSWQASNPKNVPEQPATSVPRLRLQDVHFGLCWPLRESQYLEAARGPAVAWLEKFGLANAPPLSSELYRHWKLAEGAAWLYPDGTADGVNLAAALIGWYFAPLGPQPGRDVQRAASFAGELGAIVSRSDMTAASATNPASAAFADLWQRSSKDMSAAWRARAAHHWNQFFSGQLEEVMTRANQRVPDAATHLHKRAATSWVRVLCDLMEPVCGYELPAVVWHTPVLDGLRQLVAELIVLDNDLVSAEKEEAARDAAKNLLLLFENQHGYSRPEAIEKLRHLASERVARFLHLEQRAPDFDDVLDLAGRTVLRRYLQGLRDLVAGSSQWHHTSGRYDTSPR